MNAPALSAAARELRDAFDATFTAPPPPPPAATLALLLVRAGGELLAVPRAALTGFVRAENLAPVPGRSPAFLGLAAVRGELFPVWSLAALLGRAPAPAATARWLLLTAAPGGAPCAFACEVFEQMIFVPEDRAATPGAATVSWAGALVPLADLPALHATLSHRQDSQVARASRP